MPAFPGKRTKKKKDDIEYTLLPHSPSLFLSASRFPYDRTEPPQLISSTGLDCLVASCTSLGRPQLVHLRYSLLELLVLALLVAVSFVLS